MNRSISGEITSLSRWLDGFDPRAVRQIQSENPDDYHSDWYSILSIG